MCPELDGYEIPPLPKEDLALKGNVYVSRHCGKARTFARNSLGMTDEEAKTYARQFHQQAGLIGCSSRQTSGQFSSLYHALCVTGCTVFYQMECLLPA